MLGKIICFVNLLLFISYIIHHVLLKDFDKLKINKLITIFTKCQFLYGPRKSWEEIKTINNCYAEEPIKSQIPSYSFHIPVMCESYKSPS